MTDAAASIPQSQRWTTTIDGRRLRQLRRHHRLTQRQLARQAGTSQATVTRLDPAPRILPLPHPRPSRRRARPTPRQPHDRAHLTARHPRPGAMALCQGRADQAGKDSVRESARRIRHRLAWGRRAGTPMRQASTQHPGPAPPVRRSDAGAVRLSGRDVAGLMLCGDMYGAPYDLLAGYLGVRPDRLRGIAARWRAAGYAETCRLGPGPAWCWLTRTGLAVTGLRFAPGQPALGRLAHIRAVLAARLALESSPAG